MHIIVVKEIIIYNSKNVKEIFIDESYGRYKTLHLKYKTLLRKLKEHLNRSTGSRIGGFLLIFSLATIS